MRLDELPLDILVSQIPEYILSIYDFYSLLSTNRLFYDLYGSENAPLYALPPILPRPDGQYLMQPHPHLLIAGAARQIGDWAGTSKENDDELYKCLLRENDGLLELAEKVARMTLRQMRELYELKYSLLNPLSDLVDDEVGRPDDDESNFTFVDHPDELVLNMWIYNELFHAFPDQIMGRLPAHISPIEIRTRYRWLTMCMPDLNNARHPDYERMRAGEDVPLARQMRHLEMSQFSYRSNSYAFCEIMFWDYYDTGILEAGHADSEENWRDVLDDRLSGADDLQATRRDLFITAAASLGTQSLFWMLPGYVQANHGDIGPVLKDLRDAVNRIDDRILALRYSGEHNGWLGWEGIMVDAEMGIGPNSLRLMPKWDHLRYGTTSTNE